MVKKLTASKYLVLVDVGISIGGETHPHHAEIQLDPSSDTAKTLTERGFIAPVTPLPDLPETPATDEEA